MSAEEWNRFHSVSRAQAADLLPGVEVEGSDDYREVIAVKGEIENVAPSLFDDPGYPFWIVALVLARRRKGSAS